MPPKKGGKGKGKGPAVVIDGVNTTEMTREQLEIFALRIKEELEREREERNFFQLERDKLKTFWEITRTELDEARAKLRNKDREIEIANEKNDDEIKNFRQKIKHLQYEQENHIAELKAEKLLSIKKAQDDHMEQEKELLRDKKDLKKKLRDYETNHSEEIKALKLQQSEEIYQARKHFEDLAKEAEMKYEKLYETVRQEVSTKHTMEISEVEERKNGQIASLISDHNKAFTEIKNYYNDITLNNLALISTMKDEMKELSLQNERMNKQVADIQAENKKLVEPLRQAQMESTELKRQLMNYEKDKLALANTKAKLSDILKEFDDLQWAHTALELRFEKIQAERNELHNKFMDGIMEVQQKTGLKNLLLQKKITNLQDQVENKEAALGELIAASQLQPHAVNRKLEAMLKRKNTAIKDLQYELARVAKAHDDLLQTYEAKLQTYGIPLQELGFIPLRMVPEKQTTLAKGPAGLVTKNK